MAFSIAGILGVSSAQAVTVTWNLGPSPAVPGNPAAGAIGTSQNYTANGTTITAYGFASLSSGSMGSAVNLYEKFTSNNPTETGLGLNGTLNHEIAAPDLIAPNFPNAQGHPTGGGRQSLSDVASAQNGGRRGSKAPD